MSIEKFSTGVKEWDKELEAFRKELKAIDRRCTIPEFWGLINSLTEDYGGTREDFDMLLNTARLMVTDSDYFDQ